MKCKKIQEQEKINLKLQNKKKVQKLKEKGITLIALVVTIIILLILVGVTISQITGENGLVKKAKEAVEKYKNASEEEQIQLGKIDRYINDFEIVGENKTLVSIKENGLEVTTDAENKQITVKVTVIGESTGVEYKINSEDNWIEKDTNGVKKEAENETEYTHTFGGLELGQSYYIIVKVYDKNNKYVEAISDAVILGNIMTAKDNVYILNNSATMTSWSGTTLKYAIPDEILDTSGWTVAFLLPFSYELPYTDSGYTSGSRNITATISGRYVTVSLPKYATNRESGVDDEFALTLNGLKIALVYVG